MERRLQYELVIRIAQLRSQTMCYMHRLTFQAKRFYNLHSLAGGESGYSQVLWARQNSFILQNKRHQN